LHPLDILYWACLMLGGAYTLVTLLMGGLSHAFGDAGHHVGDSPHLSHDLDIGGHHHAGDVGTGDVGHADVAHADAAPGDGHAPDTADAHHHGDHDGDGNDTFHLFSYLNPMSVSCFSVGFGGAGIISGMLGVKGLVSLLFAGASGWGLWFVAYCLLLRMFASSQGTSHHRQADLIGIRAHVTAPISGLKPGMICYTVAGTRQSIRAITDDEEPIPVGAAVRIRRIENNTAFVMRLEEEHRLYLGR
jgi:membrane protein implicated in regulation of membrane protease activity